VAESADISGLGPVAAIGIAVGLLAMITLLPALLVIVGRWIFWPLRPRYGSDEPTTRGFWAGVGRRIAVRPRAVWVTTAVLLAAPARLTGRPPPRRPALPRPPRLDRRRAGARPALPGRGRRARRGHRQRFRRPPAAGRARQHPGHRGREPACGQGWPGLPAGD